MKLGNIKTINEAVENFKSATDAKYVSETTADIVTAMPVQYADAIKRNEDRRARLSKMYKEKTKDALSKVEADSYKDRYSHMTKEQEKFNSNPYSKIALGESRRLRSHRKPMNEDLKIIMDISDYTPWSGAVSTFNRIMDEDKLDEFEAIMEELYPEGLTETELNDILWFESDEVFERLGIDDDEDADDDIDEELLTEDAYSTEDGYHMGREERKIMYQDYMTHKKNKEDIRRRISSIADQEYYDYGDDAYDSSMKDTFRYYDEKEGYARRHNQRKINESEKHLKEFYKDEDYGFIGIEDYEYKDVDDSQIKYKLSKQYRPNDMISIDKTKLNEIAREFGTRFSIGDEIYLYFIDRDAYKGTEGKIINIYEIVGRLGNDYILEDTGDSEIASNDTYMESYRRHNGRKINESKKSIRRTYRR